MTALFGLMALTACPSGDPVDEPDPTGMGTPDAMPMPTTTPPLPSTMPDAMPPATGVYKMGLQVGSGTITPIHGLALDPRTFGALVQVEGNRIAANVTQMAATEVPAASRRVRFALPLSRSEALLNAFSARSQGRENAETTAPLKLFFDDGSDPVAIGLLLPAVQKIREAAAQAKPDGMLNLDLLFDDDPSAFAGGINVASGDLDGDGRADVVKSQISFSINQGEPMASDDGSGVELPEGFAFVLDAKGRLLLRDTSVLVPESVKLRRWRTGDQASGSLSILLTRKGNEKPLLWSIPTPGAKAGTLMADRLPLMFVAPTKLLIVPVPPTMPTISDAQLLVSRTFVYNPNTVPAAGRRLITFPALNPAEPRSARALLDTYWNGIPGAQEAARPATIKSLAEAVVFVNNLESLLCLAAQPKLQAMFHPMQALYLDGKATMVGTPQWSAFASATGLAVNVPLALAASVGGALDINTMTPIPTPIVADAHYPHQALLHAAPLLTKFSQGGLFPAQINPPAGDDIPLFVHARQLLVLAAARDFDLQATAFIKAVDAALAQTIPPASVIEDINSRANALKATITQHEKETLKRYNQARSFVGLAWL